MDSYLTLKKEGFSEYIEKKSRFLGYAVSVTTEEEALLLINKIKEKYRDAKHNVYAYRIKDNNLDRYTDDKEPSGTAGVPILDMLKKEELLNVLVVVTRYFGGTLLGTGGLVRAYSKAAKDCIIDAGIAKMTLCQVCLLKVSYPQLKLVENYLVNKNINIINTDYNEEVIIEVFVKKEETEKFKDELINLTFGEIIISESEEKYFLI